MTEHSFIVSIKLMHGRPYDNERVREVVLDALQTAEREIHRSLVKTVDIALHDNSEQPHHEGGEG